MLYTLGAIAVALLVLGGYLLLVKRSRTGALNRTPEDETLTPTPKSQLMKLRKQQGLWGYRVESHCRAASGMAGQRFTLDHEPPLPASDCEIGRCRCVLAGLREQRQHIDRRSGFDRRRSMRMESAERRAERPRRREDANNWGGYGHL